MRLIRPVISTLLLLPLAVACSGEVDEERDPFFWQLSDISSFLKGGRLHLPERPGFGIEFDTDYVDRYTVDRRVSTS